MLSPSTYPADLSLGEPPGPVRYRLRPDQLLLKFAEGMHKRQIRSLLRETQLEPVGRGPRLPNRGYLPPDMLWVDVKQQPASISQLAGTLLHTYGDQLVMVSPVYYAKGSGPGSAAVPMPACLIVRFRPGADEAGKANLRKDLGLAYDAHGSR